MWPLHNIIPIMVILSVQRIQYAKSKSDCVSKAEGSFVPKEKKMKQEEKGLNFRLSITSSKLCQLISSLSLTFHLMFNKTAH